jgi:hypothetical protein
MRQNAHMMTHWRRWTVLLSVSCALLLASCTAEDVENSFSVPLKNNSSHAVEVEECQGNGRACVLAPYSAVTELKPGQSMGTVAGFGYRDSFQVSTSGGRILGCLPLQFSRQPPSNVDIRTSEVVPCDRALGASSMHGHDWPYPRY